MVIEDLGGILALLGRNGVGKSNILKSIAWYSASATNSALVAMPSWPPHLANNPRVCVEFILQGVVYQHELSVSGRLQTTGASGTIKRSLTEALSIKNANGELVPVFTRIDEEITIAGRDDTLRIGGQASVLSALRTILSSDDPITPLVNQIYKFLSSIRYYGTNDIDKSDLGRFTTLESYTQWLNEYRNQDLPGNSVIFRLIHMSLEQPARFLEFKSLLGGNGLGVISEISVHKFPPQQPQEDGTKSSPQFFMVVFQTDWESGVIPFDDLSFGTQRLLRILISLIFDQSSVLLVEQPEDGIHAGLTKKLFNILRANTGPSQIILATHSVVLFNQLKAEEVRLITKSGGETLVRGPTSDERDEATSYLMEEGTMADFLSLLDSE